MSKSFVSDHPRSVRTVVYLSPQTSAYIHSFPQRKRSQYVEKIFQDYQKKAKLHDAFAALLEARELLKGKSTKKQIVEWIRKDRRSH